MRRLEAQKLHEIDQMKSRFFANISHEFRTPLTLILGPLEQFLTDKFKGNPKEQYRMMYRYGKRLLRLINQMLDLSKLEAGRMSLQARPVNIADLLKGLVHSFASLAERKGIELKLNSQKESIIAYIDRDKLEKIITNLLSNAFKFTQQGGCVMVTVFITGRVEERLSASIERELVEIAVSDTGCGISPDRLEKIFDRFYQVDESQTLEQEGTGIGLALTKELVELHYGEIHVDSEQGKGTTFVIHLPLGKEHLKKNEIIEESIEEQVSDESTAYHPSPYEMDEIFEAESIEEKEADSTAEKSIPIILIVEDNRDVRNYIRDNLDQIYRIIEAEDGVAGFAKAVDTIPDLIISDVMMPNMDGFEFCQKIKTDEKTSHIPVILLTARASVKSKVEGLETGADDYVTKPFNVQELQVRVKNLIEQRQKLRERFSREVWLQPGDIAITTADEKFLKRTMAVLEQHISEPEFDTQTLAWEVGMSRMQLYRKLRALTDQAPREFIRIIRLRRAAQLLEQHAGNVTEIAYEVGFNSISHFAKRFHEQFGKSPSEYAVQNN